MEIPPLGLSTLQALGGRDVVVERWTKLRIALAGVLENKTPARCRALGGVLCSNYLAFVRDVAHILPRSAFDPIWQVPVPEEIAWLDPKTRTLPLNPFVQYAGVHCRANPLTQEDIDLRGVDVLDDNLPNLLKLADLVLLRTGSRSVEREAQQRADEKLRRDVDTAIGRLDAKTIARLRAVGPSLGASFSIATLASALTSAARAEPSNLDLCLDQGNPSWSEESANRQFYGKLKPKLARTVGTGKNQRCTFTPLGLAVIAALVRKSQS